MRDLAKKIFHRKYDSTNGTFEELKNEVEKNRECLMQQSKYKTDEKASFRSFWLEIERI